LKVHGRDTKVALRRAFAGALPPGILRRPKKGFGMPVGRWLKGPLRPTLERYLAPTRLARQGLFAPAYVERLVREHLAGARDHRKPLWTLLAFQLWHERHLEAL
jgi:asparagine synthase (glutamine-hydrolysing)